MVDYAIYVHIPFCKSRCGYCAFSSCTDYSLTKAYFEKLFAEIRSYANRDVKISTVYVGGGTPSSVEVEYLDKLFEVLSNNFDLSNVNEITVECNPESVTQTLLSCLVKNGVNRLSFGLQSVNDETLRRIGRIHRYSDFLKAVDLARCEGVENVNADLIIGLPESRQDFFNSVDTVCGLPLKHVSAYALELHKDSPIYKLCKERYDYSDDDLADMYDYALTALQRSGFMRYETSNFAKAGYECKHNLNYWTEGRYFAFGASASGFVGDVRFTNVFSVSDYLACDMSKLRRESETLSLFEQANEFAMLGLRLDKGVSLTQFASRFGADFFEFFPSARKLVRQGFLKAAGDFVFIPKEKSYVTNSVLCELLTL